MHRKTTIAPLCLLAALGAACAANVKKTPDAPKTEPAGPAAAVTPAAAPAPFGAAEELWLSPDISERLRQFPATRIDYDRSLLDEKETRVLQLLIEASRPIEEIFARQVAEDVPSRREELARIVSLHQRPMAIPALDYFDVMAGPWDRLKGDEAFVGRRPKPKGAGFYPADMTREELERWIAAHPADKDAFQGLFTVIRRDGDRLVAIPYSKYYAAALSRSAALLRRAAAATGNASLKSFLEKRAPAFSMSASTDMPDFYPWWVEPKL